MKVLKQRPAGSVALLEPEQVGVEGIGQLAGRVRRSHLTSDAKEDRAELGDEMLPRGRVATGAGAGERQIIKFQRLKVLFDVTRRRELAAKALTRAPRETRSKVGLGDRPPIRPCALVQTPDRSGVDREAAWGQIQNITFYDFPDPDCWRRLFWI